MHDRKTTARRVGRRLAFAAATVGTLVAISVPAALAAKPVREFLDGPAAFDIGAGEACAFPVHVDTLENKEYLITFSGRSAALADQISGRLVVRVSNGDKSIVLNVSGPGGSIYKDDGSSLFVFRGNGLLWAPTFMYAISGPAVLTLAPDGSVVAADTSKGHVVDVCALLS